MSEPSHPSTSHDEPAIDARRLHSLIDSQTTYLIRVDLEGNYTYANRAFLRKFGVEEQSVLGKSSLDMVADDDHLLLRDAAMACLAAPGTPVKVTLRKVLPHDVVFWTDWEFLAIQDENGLTSEVQCVGIDVTDRILAEQALRQRTEEMHALYAMAREEVAARQRAEEALRVQAQELKLALEAARMGAWRWDLATGEATFSDHLAQLYGIEPGDPATNSATLLAMVHPEDRSCIQQTILTAIARHEDFDLEFRMVDGWGKERWTAVKGRMFADDQDRPARLSGIARDISQRKNAEASLRQLNETLEQRVQERTSALEKEIEERLQAEADLRAEQYFARQVMEAMGQGLVVYDLHGVIDYINPCAAAMFDYAQEEIMGRPFAELLGSELLAILSENMVQRMAGRGDAYELRVEVNGLSKFVFVAATPRLRDGRPIGGIAVLTDLTERREAEDALRLREERLRLLADNTTDIISQHTLDEQLLYITPSVTSILGYTPEELLDRGNAIEIHPEDLNEMSTVDHALLLAGNTPRTEVRMRRKDGAYVWIETISRLVRDPLSSKPMSIVRSARDVTARRAAEEALRQGSEQLAAVNLELAKASRMKDEFLANMSHELRTPLTGVLGLTEGLLSQVYGTLNERQGRALRLVDESGRHLLSLINDILDLSKVEAGKMELAPEDVRVADVCEASVSIVRHLAQKRRQHLHVEMTQPDACVRADPRRLRQILVNLLSNAIKFTAEEGELGIKVTATCDSRSVLFEVWDKGIGIAPEKQDRLFLPFVQLDGGLNRQYTGTGLGLALVRRFTELQGGTVQVTSVPGEGSQFTVYLPLAAVPSADVSR